MPAFSETDERHEGAFYRKDVPGIFKKSIDGMLILLEVVMLNIETGIAGN